MGGWEIWFNRGANLSRVELEVYEFKIDKTGTEVPVEYKITVTPYDELFEPVSEGNSPVNLTVLRK